MGSMVNGQYMYMYMYMCIHFPTESYRDTVGCERNEIRRKMVHLEFISWLKGISKVTK